MLALLQFPTWSAPSISRCIGGSIIRKHHRESIHEGRDGMTIQPTGSLESAAVGHSVAVIAAYHI